MKNHGMNPYLPSWEYVPDGEPHVFGKRVYVYGSHDRFAGYAFCQNDYVCWSAPVDDLTDWQYEGILYTRDLIGVFDLDTAGASRRSKSQQADRTALPCRLSNCVNCPPMPPVTCI